MNKIAHILSNVLSPILMPTYGTIAALWLTNLASLPLSVRFNVTLMVALITAFLPALAIFVLYKMHVITDMGLNIQRERPIPYIVTCLCYLAAAWYMHQLHAPVWMMMFMIAGAAVTCICALINIVWKISAHSAAMAGMVALLLRMHANGAAVHPIWGVIFVAIILWGALGTSRLMLGRHTFWQVMAGGAAGFTLVYLLTAI